MNEIKKDIALRDVKDKIQYAANSHSITLMYEAYGYLKALGNYGVIDVLTCSQMCRDVCRQYFNNGEWTRKLDNGRCYH